MIHTVTVESIEDRMHFLFGLRILGYSLTAAKKVADTPVPFIVSLPDGITSLYSFQKDLILQNLAKFAKLTVISAEEEWEKQQKREEKLQKEALAWYNVQTPEVKKYVDFLSSGPTG